MSWIYSVNRSRRLATPLKPFEPYLNQLGERPENAVRGLMNYYVQLGFGTPDQKRATVENIIQTFGVEMAAPQTHPEQDEYVDPAVAQLQSQLEQTQKELGSIKQGFQTQQQTSQQEAVIKAQNEIETFKSEKDESGALKHPHFDKLEPAMANLYKAFPDATIPQLYQKAVALDPEIQAEVQKAAKAKEVEEAQKKAEAAKKAALVNKKAKSAPAKKDGFMSIEDAARDALDALRGA